MSGAYSYDPISRRYFDPEGKAVRLEVLRALRDTWADVQADVMRGFANKVAAGEWTLAEFESAARAWLAETVAAGYQLGRGGVAMMTPDDAFELVRLISNQTRAMELLLSDQETGRLSPAQFGARAEAQAGIAVEAFEVAQASSAGIELPAYPADGDTECHQRCRCAWEIVEFDDRWESTWITEGDDIVCEGCRERAAQWSPYVQEKGG